MIVGIDEVGVGPLAGPITLAAVMIDDGAVEGVRDSKLVAEEKRYELAELVKERCRFYDVQSVSAEWMNRVGENPVKKAWARGLRKLLKRVNKFAGLEIEVLLDGNHIPGSARMEHRNIRAIVGGDATVYAISAASLVAKATRDAQMVKLAELYPQYGFEKHKGYGTPEHLKAIDRHGLCPEHRIEVVAAARSKEPIDETETPDPAKAREMVADIEAIAKKMDIGDWERKFTASTKKQLAGDEGWITPRQMYFLRVTRGRLRRKARRNAGS